MAAPIATKLVLNTKNFTKGINAASKGLGVFKGAIGGALGLITKLGLAFTAAGVAIAAIIARQAQFIDRLGKVSDVIGVNIETLQKFRFAAEQSGISIDQADVALRRFARRLGEAQKGTGELAPALKRLGIETRNADGTIKSAEQVLLEFADGIANTENESQRLALAFKAFDSEGAELVKTLANGSEGLREFFQEAVDLGFILDRETVQGVEDFNDEVNKLQTLIGGLVNRLVAELAPALKEVTEQFIEFIKSFKDEQGSFESLGKFLKDEFLQGLATVIQIFEKITNILIAVTNAIIGLARALGVSGLPELSEDAKKAAEQLQALKEATESPLGFTAIDTENIIDNLADLGYEVEDFKKRFEELGILGKAFGTGEEYEKLRRDILAFIDTIIADLETKTATFAQVDFSPLVDILLGNTEAGKKKAAETAEDIIEEVTVIGKKLKPSFLDRILDALFPVDLVDKFFQTYEDEAATTAEKVKAFFVLVGEAIEQALPNLRDKFAQSGIGDFVTTLEDGLVKAGQMLEDSLASAIATGKADFTALGDHIKQVLAKAIVQKFITGPIMGLFGLANGGPARAGQPYIVGEEGPELFVPKQSGTVIPNDETMAMAGGAGMGMGSTQVTYNINALDSRSWKQMLAQDPEYMFNLTQAGARRVPG